MLKIGSFDCNTLQSFFIKSSMMIAHSSIVILSQARIDATFSTPMALQRIQVILCSTPNSLLDSNLASFSQKPVNSSSHTVTVDQGGGIYRCPVLLKNDVNYSFILSSTIILILLISSTNYHQKEKGYELSVRHRIL